MGRKIEARDAKAGMILRRTGRVYVWNEETRTDSMEDQVETVEVLADAELWGGKYAALSLRVVSYSGPYADEAHHQPGHEYSDGECRAWAELEVIREAE